MILSNLLNIFLIIFTFLISKGELFKIPSFGSSFKDINFKIVNGEIIDIDQFPYQVNIFTISARPKPNVEKGALCGGSIINSEYILTAGHCLMNGKVPAKPEDVEVRYGLSRLDDPDKGKKSIMASALFIHPQFDEETFHNDIAIIKLNKKLEFSEDVQKACFDFRVKNDSYLIASGYGVTTTQTETEDGEIVSKAKAGNELRFAYFRENPIGCENNFFICIEPYERGSGASPCMGDSGGPLSTPEKRVKGLSSNVFGKELSNDQVVFCVEEEDARYTRLSLHIDFIDKIVGSSNYCWIRPRVPKYRAN